MQRVALVTSDVEMSYQWVVVDGVLGTGRISSRGKLVEFRQAALAPSPDSKPNLVEFLGMEIDDGPFGRLLLTHLGGTPVGEMGLKARPGASHESPRGECAPLIYHPQHEIRVGVRPTRELFAGLGWEKFLISLLDENFLRKLCSATYHGRCAVKEPPFGAFPETIELTVSMERHYDHYGEVFCCDRKAKLIGINEDSVEAIEAVLTASDGFPDFARKLEDYKSRTKRLRALRRQVRGRLVSLLRQIQTASADDSRFREILLWLGSSENEKIPSFLSTELSEMMALSESDDDASLAFQNLYADLVNVVRRFVDVHQRRTL